MGVIEYGQEIGVFSENMKVRLDIGTWAMDKTASSTHDTPATRLKLRRLDGESVGEVSDEHLVGVFSEDGKLRLDVGDGSMRKNVSAKHLSWATKLQILPLHAQDDSPKAVKYGDVVGIYDLDRKHRLDIGSGSVPHPASAGHDSWATRLRIQDADPRLECIEIESIEYIEHEAKIEDRHITTLWHEVFANKTGATQHHKSTATTKYFETREWVTEESFDFAVGYEYKTGVPVIGQHTINITGEYKITSSETKITGIEQTIVNELPVTIPPNSKILVEAKATRSKLIVPFKLTGLFRHLIGPATRDTIRGIHTGHVCYDVKAVYKTIGKA